MLISMSNKLYAGEAQKVIPTCGSCGRKLGIGFYYSCHLCGATYCYAHSPQKCDHRKVRTPSLKVVLRR